MKKSTVLMAAILAVAVTTTLTAGLTIVPESVQEAQAQIIPGSGSNPCNIDTLDIDADEVGNNCDFYGNLEIDASSELPDRPGILPFPERLIEVPFDD